MVDKLTDDGAQDMAQHELDQLERKLHQDQFRDLVAEHRARIQEQLEDPLIRETLLVCGIYTLTGFALACLRRWSR